ncbi:MAG: Uma2 family endonuclease [bacterium]
MSEILIDNHEINYEKYLALPETMQRYEIIDGELIMSPAPTAGHQLALGNFYRSLFDFVSRMQLGFVLFAPLDVIVRRKPKLRMRQPDLIYVSNERRHIISDRIEGGPDLVLEILSPSDTRKHITAKLKDYQRIGVRECWLVSAEAETVEVLQLTPKSVKRLGLYGIGDVVRSKVLPGLELPTKKLFA